ncbi:HGGxSTG domain-containing protein [Polynucleobacter sp. MG-28-Ekke-A2]|uniref:HGGxSTG domain-containing protein n=1 Tax=Polynucleobacter sp. MG-28-Ekke-A2 TaxID=3108276 RepID=UPI002B229EF2|nr:HGGxSTG domain-containing protein [Polynucleobacter sp. MG-28-Ekke-A2]MEA9602708.1 HGGxSTG domain-containing protein [Polynucleobacter sp. MG-28-Ekke-A2]
MPKCLANKHSGGLCQNNAITGRQRCKFHGGMSLRGNQHPNYQGKGCSKEDGLRLKEGNARIKLLEMIALENGLLNPKN